jgi:MFS family permease
MMQQIMSQFNIDASHFGMLAALYYYGYSGMQIPVAMMLDRYSSRYVIFLFATICGLATLSFTYTENWYVACISRFLVGAGSAVGFLGVSKVISEWFPRDKYANMVGFSFTIGLLGAIYGGKPVSILIAHYDWQNVALVLALVAISWGSCVYLFLRSPQRLDNGVNEEGFKMVYFKQLLASKTLWLLAIANFLLVGSLEGFADVWGIQYLVNAYGLPKSDAAQLVSCIFIGMIFGGPLLAFCSKKIGNYPVIGISGLCMAVGFVFLLSGEEFNWYFMASLFTFIGILCCYQVLVFAAGSELVETKLLGVTVAFLNCINMLGGSFFHTMIGRLMDVFWSGAIASDGVRQYDLWSYKLALASIPICAFIGSILIGIVAMMTRRAAKLHVTIVTREV